MAAVLYTAYTPSSGGQEHLDLNLQLFPQQTKEEQKCACLRLMMHSAVRQRTSQGDATADFLHLYVSAPRIEEEVWLCANTCYLISFTCGCL
jgi:hypothetical protein